MDVAVKIKTLIIKPNLLGKQFDINIGEFKGKLCLPRFDENQRRPYRTSSSLSAPGRVEHNFDWGSSYHVVKIETDEIEVEYAKVKYLFLVVEVPKNSVKSPQERLESLIPRWLDNFYELATLFSNQSFSSRSHVNGSCSFLFTESGGHGYSYEKSPLYPKVIYQFFTIPMFNKLCALCQKSSITKPEHKLLRSAIDAFECEEYRSSIVDSSSALEVLLLNLIADTKKSSTNERLKSEHTQTLGQLIEEARHLKICLLYTSPSPRDQRGSRMPSSA